MANELNQNINQDIHSDSYGALINSFVDFDKEIQSKIVSGIEDDKKRAAGLFGKLLGSNVKNVILNITSLICIFVFIIIIIDLFHSYISDQNINFELINLLWPVVTLSLGYIFGHDPNNK